MRITRYQPRLWGAEGFFFEWDRRASVKVYRDRVPVGSFDIRFVAYDPADIASIERGIREWLTRRGPLQMLLNR
ncbi:MAG TPA: hypothetical protein VNA32_03755 [Actinomycetota bacterium]|nr:hypothetical protein [Actinomycetota bacterium]